MSQVTVSVVWRETGKLSHVTVSGGWEDKGKFVACSGFW